MAALLAACLGSISRISRSLSVEGGSPQPSWPILKPGAKTTQAPLSCTMRKGMYLLRPVA